MYAQYASQSSMGVFCFLAAIHPVAWKSPGKSQRQRQNLSLGCGIAANSKIAESLCMNDRLMVPRSLFTKMKQTMQSNCYCKYLDKPYS